MCLPSLDPPTRNRVAYSAEFMGVMSLALLGRSVHNYLASTV